MERELATMPSLRSSPRMRSVPETGSRRPWWRSAPESRHSIEASPADCLSASASRDASPGGASGGRFWPDEDEMPLSVGADAPDYQPEEPVSGLEVGAGTGTERDLELVA